MDCILEWREEHTGLANTHVEDLCVGGVAALLNDMAKLTLSGSYGVRQETACGERLSDNDLRTHALH